MPPWPNQGYAPIPARASVVRTGPNRLALASLVLALVATPAYLLGSVGVVVFYLVASYERLAWVSLVGSLLLSISAMFTGIVALVQAKQYAPQQRRRGWAITGLVLGSVGVVFFCCTEMLSLAALVCSGPTAC
jgi:uncharacterized YccA/Bax inhibitor family protein